MAHRIDPFCRLKSNLGLRLRPLGVINAQEQRVCHAINGQVPTTKQQKKRVDLSNKNTELRRFKGGVQGGGGGVEEDGDQCPKFAS